MHFIVDLVEGSYIVLSYDKCIGEAVYHRCRFKSHWGKNKKLLVRNTLLGWMLRCLYKKKNQYCLPSSSGSSVVDTWYNCYLVETIIHVLYMAAFSYFSEISKLHWTLNTNLHTYEWSGEPLVNFFYHHTDLEYKPISCCQIAAHLSLLSITWLIITAIDWWIIGLKFH